MKNCLLPPVLLHQLVGASAARTPQAIALIDGARRITYETLAAHIEAVAAGLLARGLQRGERVAVWLDKRIETVVACFAASRAGLVFVPINPVLKAHQVDHILRNCTVSLLIGNAARLALLDGVLSAGPPPPPMLATDSAAWADLWQTATAAVSPAPTFAMTERDVAAIFYTSGSTGKPKGVVLAQRNLVAGAFSVAQYLGNRADDALLAALPLSFDAGFSQLTTAFAVGARVVLLNYLTPRDVLRALAEAHISGITAVPPLYNQLVRQPWPADCARHLRYFANTGGHLPRATLDRLRQYAPQAQPFLMYGLTEAFRATYLPPEEIDRRPDSIGKAIPNNEIHILRPDGTPCAPGETGELVQRGPLVALGYWGDPLATAERFRPLPAALCSPRPEGHDAIGPLPLPEYAVYSGDLVRADAAGFLYFVGRRDEMIKTSGYRVSPTEVEEALHATGLVAECIAFGVPHADLGQSIRVVAVAAQDGLTADALLDACRPRLPAYMQPATADIRTTPLPRNANGKIDRSAFRSPQP